jgi:Fe-S oxidoreductase
MMGQREAGFEVAKQNVEAFVTGGYDAIITLCASCGAFLKNSYMDILETEKGMQTATKAFCGRITDFSSFVHDRLGLKAEDFKNTGEKVTYHAACHLCRGLDVTKAPRELIAAAAEYVPCVEEDVCCGFGGSYSMKFPEISAQLLENKLANVSATGATRIVMDCPGCVMQLRGGVEKKKLPLKVSHIAELLVEGLKQ